MIVQRSIGKQVKPSKGYGTQHQAFRDRYLIAVHRGLLQLMRLQGCETLIVSIPFVVHYDAQGKDFASENGRLLKPSVR